MATLGTAWIQIKPTVKGLSSSIKQELAGAEGSISNSSSGIGSKISHGIIGGLKTVGAAALGVATTVTGAIGGIVATGGFDRAMSIEQAQFKLKGLGHSAEAVDSIMNNALASVKDTAFGLDEAATVAASAVAAGIKPGQELERTLKLVADAATIGGVGMDEMGAIFNKVAANGKMTREELNQLTDKGIPMIALLSKSMGKSTEEINTLISQGKIGFEDFQKAIEKGMGGAARTMGQTFSGAVANANAALRRLGEGIMTPVMNELTPLISEVTGLIDDIAAGTTEKIDERMLKIEEHLNKAVESFIGGLVPVLEAAVPIAVDIIQRFFGLLPRLINKLLPTIVDAAAQILYEILAVLPWFFSDLVDSLNNLVPILTSFIFGIVLLLSSSEVVNTILSAIRQLITTVLSFLIEAMPIILDALPQIISTITEFVIGLAKLLTMPSNLQIIFNAAIDLFLSLVRAIPDIISALAEALPEIIQNIVTFLTNPQTIGQLIYASVELFMALVKAVPMILGALFGAFGALLGTLWERLQSLFKNFVGNFGNAIAGIFRGAVNGVLGFIENFVNGPIDTINGFIDTINSAFGAIGVNIGHIGRISLGRMAQGGLVGGIGTATSDSNLFALSKGEYVIRASAAKSIGYDRLSQMNESGRIENGGVITNITINGYNKDPNELANIISRKIALKQAGVLS